jgi:hypothetical protein
MKQAALDQSTVDRIAGFRKRKFQQYPDLSRSVSSITRELEAQDRASSILQMEEDPRAERLDQKFDSYHQGRVGSLQYAA